MNPIPRPLLLLPLRRFCFAAILLLSAAGTVRASTIYYVKPGGVGTGTTNWANAMGPSQLQAAINGVAAAGGGQVWVAAGTYYPNAYPTGATGTSSNRDYAFTLANNVAIYGGFNGTETLLSQRNFSTHVTILSGDINTSGVYTDDCYHILLSTANNNTAILDGFTIEYGYANGGATTITYSGVQMDRNHGGAIFIQASQPMINNCIFSANTAASGGAIYNYNTTSPPLFTNSTFSGNSALTTTATDGGGAIYNYNNTYLTLTTCVFSGNTSASDGGGIFSNNTCNMTLTSCDFTSNIAAGSGGGFVNEASSIAALINCSFTSNKANSVTAGGGAICNNSTNGFSASGCTFTGNISGEYGGGIYFMSGSSQSTMNNCSFGSNSAVYGGGISAATGSNQTLSTTTFTSNSATYGGGVYNYSSNFTYTSCTFQSNSAGAATGMAGGGECNDNGANGSMLHCLFLNNVSTGDGAGQYNNSSNALDSECVFNGNVSHGNGGGMVDNGGNPKAWNCVLSDNTASSYGGGYYNILANATFMNNTVYNNAANGAGGYGDGIYVASGSPKIYNDIVWSRSNAFSIGLVYATGVTPKVQYSDTQGALFAGTGNISTAPTFGNSGNYAGADGIWATADDGLHLVNSSAGASVIPVASATAYDITMTTRPVPGPLSDMGAYEGGGTFIVLAVQLVDLTAVATGDNTIQLRWQTNGLPSEAGCRIQRSTDGLHFSTIGNTRINPGQVEYQFQDQEAAPTVDFYYYRLLLDASQGDTLVSPIVVVRMVAGRDDRLSIRSSGAARSGRVLYFRSAQPELAHLVVTDAAGHICWSRTASLTAGENFLPLDLPPSGRGIYFLVVSFQGAKGADRRTIPFLNF
jgi:predicted outer membrane repeat protein